MISQKTVSYAVEVDALLGLVLTLVSDIKAAKEPGLILADLLPKVVASLGGIGGLPDELKQTAVIEQTVSLKLAEILNVLVG